MKYYVRGENIGSETRCREFKLGRGDLDTHLPCAVSKYVSSFLNSEGGTLMLGVNDKGERSRGSELFGNRPRRQLWR